MKILFICKYNRFRSKVAEAYLKKINKNANVISRGIIEGEMNRNKKEIIIPEQFGLQINSPPVGIEFADLKWADYVIVVASNVPKRLFESRRIKNKVIQWDIPDVYPDSSDMFIKKVILQIMKKVDKLNEELK
jgi:protein-tyrosine-phosphatase